MSLENTEAMWVRQQRKELNNSLEVKKIWQGSRFGCLSGTVTEDSSSEAEVTEEDTGGCMCM